MARIKTYKLSCDKQHVDKSTYLTQTATINGTFRNSVDIMRPVVNVELTEIPTFNYIYIEDLTRYYYIDKYEILNNKLYRLYLTEDTLYSHITKIKALYGTLSRYQNGGVSESPFLIDDRLPRMADADFSKIPFTNGADYSKIRMATTSPIPNNFLVMVANPTTNLTEGTPSSPSDSPMVNHSTIYSGVGVGGDFVVMNKGNLKALIDYLSTNDFSSIFSRSAYGQDINGLISVRCYPFDIPTTSENLRPFRMFGRDISSVQCYDLKYTESPILNIGKFTPSISSFKDFEPYSNYSLYIPFVGWVEINAVDMINGQIKLEYVIDYGTGEFTAFISSLVDKLNIAKGYRIIKSINGRIGLDVPITSSNALEQMRNYLNSGANFISGGLSVAGGMATGNPLAIGAGALGLARSGVSMLTNPLTFKGGTYTSEISRHTPTEPMILKQAQKFEQPLNYANTQGFPSMKYHAFDTLTGYVEVGAVHMDGFDTATQDEINDIDTQLKNGVIF